MPEILHTPKFVRLWQKLPCDLQDEVEQCLDLLAKDPTNTRLKTHKLTGALAGCLSCSVNYKYRVVFQWDDPKTIVTLAVGDHDVYR
jgi:mRNA interferase YafQ